MDFSAVLGSNALLGPLSSNAAGSRARAGAAAASGGGGGGGGGGGSVFASLLASLDQEPSSQRVLFGSSHFKHGRASAPDEHDWRSLKKTKCDLPPSAIVLRSNFQDGEQMLSFSTNAASPYYHQSPYASNTALGSGSSNGSIQGSLAGIRGAFSVPQWMELKQQALIYSYIDAKMPIPSSLLMSIRRDYSPSGFSAFSLGSYGSYGSYGSTNSLGWGSFHLGFSGNADPEPGRCRRTDGKKWRCSRDAVVDQKYCERHINRGRHRSRKHVEGPSGHAAKEIPVVAPSQSASSISAGRTSNSLSIAHQHIKNLQPNVIDTSPTQFIRVQEIKERANDCIRNPQDLSMLTAENPKPNTLFPISKHALEGTSATDYGFISTETFLNLHPEKISFGQQPQSHSLRHFIDDWPKDHSDPSTITWPEETPSDRTQLSISIPMASDFASSPSSPDQGKVSLSPLRMSKELDPFNMGLGVGGTVNEVTPRQASWVPISWESSLGGPLGEVLGNTSSTPRGHSKNCSSSSLNLLTDGWDISPRMHSSPTDVLHNATFGSLSSSTGSSPRAENYKANDSTSSMREHPLGSTFVNALTIPLL